MSMPVWNSLPPNGLVRHPNGEVMGPLTGHIMEPVA